MLPQEKVSRRYDALDKEWRGPSAPLLEENINYFEGGQLSSGGEESEWRMRNEGLWGEGGAGLSSISA